MFSLSFSCASSTQHKFCLEKYFFLSAVSDFLGKPLLRRLCNLTHCWASWPPMSCHIKYQFDPTFQNRSQFKIYRTIDQRFFSFFHFGLFFCTQIKKMVQEDLAISPCRLYKSHLLSNFNSNSTVHCILSQYTIVNFFTILNWDKLHGSQFWQTYKDFLAWVDLGKDRKAMGWVWFYCCGKLSSPRIPSWLSAHCNAMNRTRKTTAGKNLFRRDCVDCKNILSIHWLATISWDTNACSDIALMMSCWAIVLQHTEKIFAGKCLSFWMRGVSVRTLLWSCSWFCQIVRLHCLGQQIETNFKTNPSGHFLVSCSNSLISMPRCFQNQHNLP